jgi:para-nitrobenzyl esterase
MCLPAMALDTTVRIDSGSLRGAPTDTPGVNAYKGIPFAAPPVGNLRWRAPQPPAAWEGVRKADEFGAGCIQRKSGPFGPWSAEYISRAGMAGGASEDCLYLNVWSAAKSAGERRPVLVWIHGGGFNSGSGDVPVYDGEGLASKGLVVITINYRVGALGFLTHPELTQESAHHASGNYALLDMIAALQWTKRNVAAFGGDAGNVTIAGQSAGSYAVNFLVASPLARGLFHRAIGESGGAFRDAQDLKDSEQDGVKLAKSMQAASLAELRALPAEAFLHTGGIQFGPVVDGYAMPKDVQEIFEASEQNDVPTLTGWNLNEGAADGPPVKAEAFRQRAAKQYGSMLPEFLKAFPAETDEQAAESQRALGRDQFFAWQGRTWARMQAQYGKSKAFLYEFDRTAPGTPEQLRFGAFHSGEIPYALNTLARWERPWEEADRKLAATMSSYWANFARSGDPNGAGLPKWPAYGGAEPRAMRLGLKLEAIPVPHKAELDFLDAFHAHAKAN